MDLFPIYTRQARSRTRYKVGYIDSSGEVIVNPTFDEGSEFYEGLASVKVGRHWGFIDSSGRFVIPPSLSGWGKFHEGLATIPTGRKNLSAVIDQAGNVVIPPKYPYVGRFRDGLALFRNGPGDETTRFGFIDRSGTEVIPAVFHRAKSFSEGMAAVRVGRLWGYIGTNGVFTITPRFDAIRNGPKRSERTQIGGFCEGLAVAWGGNGYGFIDKAGNFVTRSDFEEAEDFREGRARVKSAPRKRFGYIDRFGSVVIDACFPSASSYFSEGLASVKEKEDRPDYSKGVASVKLDQMAPWGFIDVDGKMLIAPRFFSTQNFQGGICLVQTEKTIGYINKNGAYIWEGPYVEYGIV
jgi:hypothetical protein